MPNKNQHRKIGTVAGAIVLAAWDLSDQINEMKKNPEKEFDLLRLIGKTALGAIGGYTLSRLPDILEPAKNPNHRKFFHSVAFGGIVTYGTIRLNQSGLPKSVKQTGTALAVGCLSHIVADATTPKSIGIF